MPIRPVSYGMPGSIAWHLAIENSNGNILAISSSPVIIHSIVNQPLKGKQMSVIDNLILDIQKDITEGRLTFREIADLRGIPFDWVDMVALEMARQGEDDPEYLDSDAYLETLE
jgi:hypothetical protein